ncbi:MAG: alpha/beta hydrolase [Proteobacteria bacterium]|nr:alpha/beta hydrolase [Pseudomonadota bacterium]
MDGTSLLFLLFIAVMVLVGAFFLLAPRPTLNSEPPRTRVPDDHGPADLVDWLKAHETAHRHVVAGAEASIVWAGQAAARTPLCLLYLHGFSASRQETAPLCDHVAAELGANLVYTRLAGHGLAESAMEATAEEWIASALDGWEIASRLGEKVVIVATSTGAPLAVWLCQHITNLDQVHSLVFLSPNFKIRNPFGFMLTWPLADRWISKLVGEEHSWEPENEQAARYWTHRYSVNAVIEMQKIVDWARKYARTDLDIPLLTVYMEGDPTISDRAAVAFHRRWGSKHKLLKRVPIDDTNPQHVFVGSITAPHRLDWTTTTLLNFIRGQFT